MTRTSNLLLALLLLPSVAGCIQPGEPEQNGADEAADGPAWGLGLTIPTEAPGPGPYIEGEDAIESLRARIDAVAPKVLAMCEEDQALEDNYTSTWNDRFNLAIGQLFSACLSDYSAEARERATQDEISGNYAETYRELNRSAWVAFNATIERVSSLPAPRSTVDVAVQVTIQGRAMFLNDMLNAAELVYKPYEAGTGNHLNLVNAYLNLLGVINAPKMFDAFLNSWKWDRGVCQAPDLDELRMEVEVLVEDARRAIEQYGDPEAAQYVSSPEGALLKGSIPGAQWALDRGWWPQVLGGLETMPWLIRHIETAGDATLPTREEALHLVAMHRAEQRSITTDHHLLGLHENILQNPDWEQFPNEARAALAVPALQPRVALTPCS